MTIMTRSANARSTMKITITLCAVQAMDLSVDTIQRVSTRTAPRAIQVARTCRVEHPHAQMYPDAYPIAPMPHSDAYLSALIIVHAPDDRLNAPTPHNSDAYLNVLSTIAVSPTLPITIAAYRIHRTEVAVASPSILTMIVIVRFPLEALISIITVKYPPLTIQWFGNTRTATNTCAKYPLIRGMNGKYQLGAIMVRRHARAPTVS